jgi:hypothetical protein
MENMVPQENDVLSTIPDEKFWLISVFVRNLG